MHLHSYSILMNNQIVQLIDKLIFQVALENEINAKK